MDKKNNIMFLSKVIMVEQRYLALKDSPQFQRRMEYENKNQYFSRYISTSYAMNAMTFSLFSVLLNSVYFGEKNYASIASLGLIFYIYLFILGIYNSLVFLNSIYVNNIMSPLKSVPIKVNVNVPFISWFIYNASSYIFIIMPSIIFFFLLKFDYQTVFLGLLFSFAILLLSFIISSVIFIYGGQRSKKHSSVKNVIKILSLFIFLGVFYSILENPAIFSHVTVALNSLPYDVKYLIFPVNLEYLIYLNYNAPLFLRLIEITVSIIILLAFLFIYSKIRYKLYNVLMTSEENSSSEIILSKIKSDKLYKGFLKKDIKSTFRKSQNLTYIFLPILFTIPLFLEIGTGVFSSTLVLLIYLTIFVSSFYSLFLLVIEGKGIEILNSLPVTRNQISYYKSIFGLIIFSVIAVAVIIILSLLARNLGVIDIIEFIDIILLFYIILYTNIRKLIKKLPAGVSNLNYYSFGKYPLLPIFIISIIVLVASILPVLGISYILYHNIYHSLFSFVSINIFINIIIFIITVPNKNFFKIRKSYK